MSRVTTVGELTAHHLGQLVEVRSPGARIMGRLERADHDRETDDVYSEGRLERDRLTHATTTTLTVGDWTATLPSTTPAWLPLP